MASRSTVLPALFAPTMRLTGARPSTRSFLKQRKFSISIDVIAAIQHPTGNTRFMHRSSQGRWPRYERRSPAPARGDQAALAVAGERDVGGVERVAVPQLAGDLLVLLVERLAVVGELAAPDLVAAALADLEEPVGIGQALARRRDQVGLAALEDRLGLRELAD